MKILSKTPYFTVLSLPVILSISADRSGPMASVVIVPGFTSVFPASLTKLNWIEFFSAYFYSWFKWSSLSANSTIIG